MNNLILPFLLLLTLGSYAQVSGGFNTKLTPNQFAAVVSRCAPLADIGTMLAIATTESALHVDSISLNRPVQSARRLGLNHHRLELMRQPHTKAEALRWMQWFSERQYTVSVGLMQINIENARLFHVAPEQLFDPCTNIAIGASVLARTYRRGIENHQEPHQALLDAISTYNSGSSTMGYSNGYVHSVVQNSTLSK
jgi:type IV secretion system protein VirB1